MGVIITVLAFVLVGGGVSYAAEGSVPGDALYPVKVKVNENVVSALAVSDEAKARWEARLAERRLEEAEVLAADGRLDEDTGAELEERFREHAERTQERVTTIAEKRGPESAATLSSHFESSLKAHEKVLSRLSDDPKADGKAGALATAVGDEADQTEADRHVAEDDLDAKVNEPDKRRAAESRLAEAQSKIAETESYLAKREGKFAPEATEAARAVLAQADGMVQEGVALMGESDFGGAFRKFQEAHLLASRAKVTLVMSERLGISIPPGDDGPRGGQSLDGSADDNGGEGSYEHADEEHGDDEDDAETEDGEEEDGYDGSSGSSSDGGHEGGHGLEQARKKH